VLELGGKNPTIVHSSAECEDGRAADRVRTFPELGARLHRADYVLVWPDVKDEFVDHP
jgi:acyl-CoA reductase-like NAD-dependent aldehyde dehydrogenase